MKSISIILDHYLANWILSGAQKHKITISEFIRNLLYEKMQQGAIIINYNNKFKQDHSYNKIDRAEMRYIIFTAKLLEKLVLSTEEQGEVLHNLAIEETKIILEQMNFNSKKQRLCISLENNLFAWLTAEATKLQIKVIPLIRKIVEGVFIQNQIHVTTMECLELSAAQKVAIKYQIMTYKLLEKLVNHTVDDAEAIIQEAKITAEDLWLNQFSKENKIMPVTSNSVI